MPPIPLPSRPERPPRSPEELYDRLDVTDAAIGALWRHQSHVLRAYHDDHASTRDVALELPTGAGKTLVGLLIADWRRRTTGAPAALLCPTRQLAGQAAEKAAGYGIPAVLLTGKSRLWDASDETRGLGGNATIISTYNHIFNTAPRLTPRTLVLDDAHAAEGNVAGNWSVAIGRGHLAYRPVLEAVAAHLRPEVADDLRNDGLPPNARPGPVLVGPADLAADAPAVLDALTRNVARGEEAHYALGEIRGHLSGCVLLISHAGLLVRPMVPPTRFHPAFENAEQRVYLSATLGSGGELERAFGRTRIARVEIPSDWERHGSGRRLALLPRAGMDAEDASAFIRRTIANRPRTLVLVPSNPEAERAVAMLPDGWTVLRKQHVDDRLSQFTSSERTALVLANRYDGIDLPGETCELIVISGLPAGTHMLEQFLAETAQAGSALRERIRTRLMQGMGRATRSRSDRAVVLFAGEWLLRFLRDPDNLTGLRAELQAELGYGIFLAEHGADLDELVDTFLNRSADWGDAESFLREKAEEADLDAPPGADQLAVSAPSEVLACEAAWRGDHDQAAAHALQAVRSLSAGAVGGYRTVWKTLAAHWAAVHAGESGDPLDARLAVELGRDAAASARTRQWRPPIPHVAAAAAGDAVDVRGVRAADLLATMSRSPRVDRYVEELSAWIGDDDARKFERGLERLGLMLGFEAVRPNVKAAPDGAWRSGDRHVLWEAKSEQLEGGEISAKIARQANTHATWVERELDWSPDAPAVTYLVSPRAELDDEARAVVAEHVRLVAPADVRDLAVRAAELWRALIPRAQALTRLELAEAFAAELDGRGLATAQLDDTLNARRTVA